MALDEIGAKPCPEDTCMHLQCLTHYNTQALKYLSLPSEEAQILKNEVKNWDNSKLATELNQTVHHRNSQENEVLVMESLSRLLKKSK